MEENKCKYIDETCNHTLALCQSCYIYKKIKGETKRCNNAK